MRCIGASPDKDNELIRPRPRKRVSQVPEVAVKEERRVLEYASDGLNGKIGCLGKPHCLDGL